MHQNERFPADCLLLYTTEKNGSVFIRTDQLDGETDWKLRKAIAVTQQNPMTLRQHADWYVVANPPNDLIYDFKGFFSTIGMSVLWPLRVLQKKSTGRWYANSITPKPEAVGDVEFVLSLLPVTFVLVWPWVRVVTGEINAVEGFFTWWYPWAVTGAIWTVMTQVSHVQEDCQRPPTGDADDYFRWQVESALDYSVHNELVPKLTASLSLQSMHHVMPSVCGCHFARLYPEYKQICERHGVRLNTRSDVSAAWRSCIGRVFELSSPDLTPAWALDDAPAADGRGGLMGAIAEHGPLAAYLLTPALAMLACSPLF